MCKNEESMYHTQLCLILLELMCMHRYMYVIWFT